MKPEPHCPQCNSEYTYADGNLWICPECAHEWSQFSTDNVEDTDAVIDTTVKDANGQELVSGDSVVVIKDLKVKGSSQTIKSGTKVKNIRLSDDGNGHNIACKIDGVGAMNLKSEFVKKV